SRVFADILNRPIHQVEDPLQANARGAAFIASVGMGQISFDDIPQLVKTTGEYLPDNRNRALYDDLYHAFLEIYKRNRTLYDRLNSSDNKG
ncbi:MAG TPA: xylulose kinase, partial [Spirochaetota bacterium]|nr:xylulose kinase [Spirochaetota bacterium]